MTKPIRRTKKWVDDEIQGAVVRRVLLYWGTCMLFLTFTLLLVATIQDPTRFFFQHAGGVMARFWPVYLLLTVLLPLTVVDAVQVSNRIAGPIFRLRRHLHEVAEGKTVSELKFRDDDFWIELAPDVDAAFNKIREQEKAKLKEDLVEA